jgi:hypothetical protein
MVPLVTHALVTQQDPDHYGLFVVVLGFGGGQGPVLSVKVASHGPRDGVRGDFPELPQPGNIGIVAFPHGDMRNGVWLGSFESTLNDASPNAANGLPNRYQAHYAGGWHYVGPDGTTAAQLADGTQVLAGASMPVPTRHTLDGTQVRKVTPYTAAERNPSPPGAFPLSIAHPSGARLALTGSGAGTVTIPSGQGLTLSCGGATVVLDGSGDATVTTSGTLTLKGPGGTQVVLAGGTVVISAGGAAEPVKLASGGNSTVLMAQ